MDNIIIYNHPCIIYYIMNSLHPENPLIVGRRGAGVGPKRSHRTTATHTAQPGQAAANNCCGFGKWFFRGSNTGFMLGL